MGKVTLSEEKGKVVYNLELNGYGRRLYGRDGDTELLQALLNIEIDKTLAVRGQTIYESQVYMSTAIIDE